MNETSKIPAGPRAAWIPWTVAAVFGVLTVVLAAALLLNLRLHRLRMEPLRADLELLKRHNAELLASRAARQELDDRVYEATRAMLMHKVHARDRALDELREQLFQVRGNGKQYTALADEDLAEAARRAAGNLREFGVECDQTFNKMSEIRWYRFELAKTPERQLVVWKEFMGDVARILIKWHQDYEQKFKADAMLLRDEMLARLPPEARNDDVYPRYARGLGTYDVMEIADDLFRLAGLLQSR